MTIPQTPTSVDPGPAGDFKWKGLNWRRQSYLAAIPGNIVLNGDGTITCRQTAQGGMEMESTKGGLGYGDYYIVTDSDLAALPPGVVWGGHFPYDNTDPRQEFDNQEASTWGGGGVKFRPHHWSSGGSEVDAIRVAGVPRTNNFEIPSGGPWCHVTKWRPGRVDYFIYRALDASDPSKLYYHAYSTTGIPTPKASTTQHINLWQYPRTAAKRACTVHLVDFSFIPAAIADKPGTVVNPSIPTPVPNQPAPTTPTTPPASGTGSAVSVVNVTATYPVKGVNVARGAGEMVVYTPAFGPATTTNEWGVEAAVAGGKVTQVIDRRGTGQTAGLAIPRNGAVISGHDAAADWIKANLKVGTTVLVPTA